MKECIEHAPRRWCAACVPCQYCRSPRVNGIRTCGVLCLIGVDPRLAAFLGVAPWVAAGRRPYADELPIGA